MRDVSSTLREIANVSAASASATLSRWLRRPVRLSTEGFVRTPLRETYHQLESEEPVYVLHMELGGQLRGSLLLLIDQDTTRQLTQGLIPACEPQAGGFDELMESLLRETANILAAAFTSSFAERLDLHSLADRPELMLDMPQAAVGALVAEHALVGDDVLVTRTAFEVAGQSLPCAFYVLLMPDSYRLVQSCCN